VIDLTRPAGSAVQTPGSSNLLDSSLTANGQQQGTRHTAANWSRTFNSRD